ncbi:CHASE4 domain-containing protein [Desulfobacterales bacterium HSG16]|nr:CHASE4 domain-containing protein [Desulfobacterales bacterium HSG16]
MRVMQAVQRDIHHLDSLCHDWSAWDETYTFVQTASKDYVERNLPHSNFSVNSLNLIYICDIEGRVIWGEIYDYRKGTRLDLLEFPEKNILKSHPLIKYKTKSIPLESVKLTGIFMTSKGPMLVASRPILNNDNEGPPKGFLIMGRFLDDSMVKTFVEQIRVNFTIFPIQSRKTPDRHKETANRLTDSAPFFIEEKNDEYIAVYSAFQDVEGKPALLMKATISRKITAKGKVAIEYALISILTAGISLLFIMLLLLQKFVVGPITHLKNQVLSLGKSGYFSIPVDSGRNEIGTLAKEFDKMLRKLSESKKKLLDQSYYSGMARMSVDIIHNVRNSLIEIVGNVDRLKASFNKLPVTETEMAGKELEQQESGDKQRRQDMIRFMILANRQFAETAVSTTVGLNDIAKQIGHIETILDAHRHWASIEHVSEPAIISDMIQDAIQMSEADSDDSIKICIDKNVSADEIVMTRRIELTQILVQILSNAVESIQALAIKNGQIQIKADVEKNEKNMIHISICDNGGGINQKDMSRIFERGYSTKKEIHLSSIGLHWCANTIALMDGRIYASNDGLSRGVCFHIVLPKQLSADYSKQV